MQERAPFCDVINGEEGTLTSTWHYTEDQSGPVDLEIVRQRALRHTSNGRQLSESQLAWLHAISTSNPDAQFPLVTHKLITDPEGELLHEVFEGVGGLQAIIEPNPDAAGAFNLNLNSPVEHGHI